MKQLISSLCVTILGSLSVAHAEVPQTLGYDGIAVRGKSEAIVSTTAITLGDVAEIASPRVEDDQQIMLLKKLPIAPAPKAGESIKMDASRVLQRLQEEGIALNSIRYSLPREVVVTRSFREISLPELELALHNYLGKNPTQLDVKKISLDKPVRVPSDTMGVEVVALQTTNSGHIGIDYRTLSGMDEARFQLKATAESWRMLPVAGKPLKKGERIDGEDVKLIKLSDTASNKDAIENVGDILGRTLTRDVGQGEVFRANAITIPPVVVAGSKVSLIVRSGRLEVTASGTAAEAGALGQEIKVMNDSSHRVVSGKVEGPGVVVVGAQ